MSRGAEVLEEARALLEHGGRQAFVLLPKLVDELDVALTQVEELTADNLAKLRRIQELEAVVNERMKG